MEQAQGLTEYDRVEASVRDWDMQALWPRLPAQAIQAAQVHLASVVRSVLAQDEPPPVIEVGDELELAATGVGAFLSGVGPLLGYWIERGQLRASPSVAQLLGEHLRQGRLRSAFLQEQLGRLLVRFRRSQIIPVLLKGMLTSRRYFPEPGTRPVADIDLLVEPQQLLEAKSILRQQGFVETAQTWKSTPWMLPEAGRTVRSLELDHAENPWSVDLHRSIDFQYFRGVWARYGDLPWTHVAGDEAAGQEVRCFTQPLLAAHLAQHASLHRQHLRLIRVLELVLVLRRDLAAGTLDWDSLSNLLTGAGLWRFVYPALESAERLAPGLLDPQFRRRLSASATPRSRRILEQVAAAGWGGQNVGARHRVADKFAWFQGPREAALNLVDLVLPAEVPIPRYLAFQARRLRLLFQRAA